MVFTVYVFLCGIRSMWPCAVALFSASVVQKADSLLNVIALGEMGPSLGSVSMQGK